MCIDYIFGIIRVDVRVAAEVWVTRVLCVKSEAANLLNALLFGIFGRGAGIWTTEALYLLRSSQLINFIFIE